MYYNIISAQQKNFFATKKIKKGQQIIQYIGEKVTKKEGDKRSEKRIKKYLNSKTTGSVYIFELYKKFDIERSEKMGIKQPN